MEAIKDMIDSGTAELNKELIKSKYMKALSPAQQNYAQFLLTKSSVKRKKEKMSAALKVAIGN